MNQKTKKWGIIGIVAIVIIGIIIAVSLPKHLKGTYTTSTGSSFVFDGDTVKDMEGGSTAARKGTYQIKDDELTMKFSEYDVKATLADDKKSFTIKSTGNSLLDLVAKGLKYTQK
ncbi:hypothetical protein EFP00_08695 [Lactiplantibacillus paraplantarum]|uniref:hypothetical protein n=1 Tax=Lactiplantibacillus paraplantarum TaxID=60520 RepID=UPI0021A71154|nr:hypothetical protein [Lactiplantibacillus paraplantarum]MCT4457504.1 hypothetical protein [Lactiplantibacillus paraplantarum]